MKTDTIIRPIITERSTHERGVGKFTFAVAVSANKQLIKQAIQQQFSVNVISVATRTMKGKKHRVGVRRTEVTKSPWKKATIKLKAGEKIDIFEVSAK